MADRADQLFDPESPPGVPDAPPGEAPVEAPAQERAGVLSIGGLYDEVEGALGRAFPRNRPLWVRGEIHHLSDHRSGHLYLDLVDPDDAGRPGASRGRGAAPVLSVKCWRTTWGPLRHRLAKEGIELAQGMVVVLRGTLDLYRAKGEISLILVDVDVAALLGQMAAQRAQLLRTLEAEGLLRRNASLVLPDLPLHIGLIASRDTEGCRDFLGQLTGAGFGFRISQVKVPVQGPGAPASIARALAMLSRSDCDLIAMVRGGGARADLAAFESELVARAVAEATKPVFTGIGHTGDETVADIVAARACITPTECGQAIVARTRQWWAAHVAGPASSLARRVPGFLTDAQARDTGARGRLTVAARHQLRIHHDRLATRAEAAARRAPTRVAACEEGVIALAARLGPLALGHLARRDEQVRSWRRLLAAYDVDRQLERGYSLTTTADGALVRRVADVAPDQEIVTRLADGTVRSTVGMVKTVNRVNRVNGVEKTDTETETTTKDGKA
ncbi:MAG TPA: exodeoxyribonuclease VII large subunit [Acidimicrobiales bacterium]|nr:exodeoxyribonuclease VII large subunit [Acidimicrobiales bacterium]